MSNEDSPVRGVNLNNIASPTATRTPKTQPPAPPRGFPRNTVFNSANQPMQTTSTGTYTNPRRTTTKPSGRTVQETPTTTFQPPPPPQQYTTIGGVVYRTVTTENTNRTSGVSYSKAWRANLDDKARMEFLKQIESPQQILFTFTTISVNDPSNSPTISHYRKQSLNAKAPCSNTVSMQSSPWSNLMTFKDQGPVNSKQMIMVIRLLLISLNDFIV